MRCIGELELRANLNHFTLLNGRDVVVYDDHRTLFSVVYGVQKCGVITQRPNLIYFDYHDDCVIRYGMSIADRRAAFGNRPISHIELHEAWTHMEFGLSPLDDDWLTAVMDLNWVGDAVVVGAKEHDNIHNLNKRYSDEQDQHHLYRLEHLDYETGRRGKLGDMMLQDDESRYLRRLFGYNGAKEDCPYILDFDLDCFTTRCCGRTMAWPHDIFREKYVDNRETYGLMLNLIANASLITICREPGCCGGFGESHKILSYLDSYFFGGQLKTEPIE